MEMWRVVVGEIHRYDDAIEVADFWHGHIIFCKSRELFHYGEKKKGFFRKYACKHDIPATPPAHPNNPDDSLRQGRKS